MKQNLGLWKQIEKLLLHQKLIQLKSSFLKEN